MAQTKMTKSKLQCQYDALLIESKSKETKEFYGESTINDIESVLSQIEDNFDDEEVVTKGYIFYARDWSCPSLTSGSAEGLENAISNAGIEIDYVSS